jgi:hypothetical protein
LNFQKAPEEIVKTLRSGSNVLLLGNSEHFDQILGISKEINYYHYTGEYLTLHDKKTKNCNPNEVFQTIIEFWVDTTKRDNSIDRKMVIETVLNNPRVYFQLDLLFVGDLVDRELLVSLQDYIHPGGIMISKKELGNSMVQKKNNEWTYYFPEVEAWNVPFARMSISEKKWIADNASNIPKGGIYAETGSYKGGSAVIAAMANQSIRVFCIDPWVDYSEKDKTAISTRMEKSYDSFLRHTQFFENIIPVRINIKEPQLGPELLAKAANMPIDNLSIDMLFIDGDHSVKGVITDLSIYLGITYGLVCGHDYKNIAEVRKGVDVYYTLNIIKKALMLKAPLRLWHSRLQAFLRPDIVQTCPEVDNSIWFQKH